MDWRHACTTGFMQVEDPEQGTYLMPIAWYFAPADALTFFGVNAFTSGVWDRDQVELPPQLGEQPPYGYPFYNGLNIWGYVGQCRLGTDSQFANGLSAADLVAVPPAIPACCAPALTGQLWFLRHSLTPPQTVVPGTFTADWFNAGDATTAALLSPLPGDAPGGPTAVWESARPPFPGFAMIQYLTAPLPAQTILAQNWTLVVGELYVRFGAGGGGTTADLNLIDGSTGLVKTALTPGGFTVVANLLVHPSPHAYNVSFPVIEVDAEFGDYLCLELGHWISGGISPPSGIAVTQLDSGTNPETSPANTNGSPLAYLSWGTPIEDTDVPLPGTVLSFAGPNVPAGYLACDGTVYTSAAYPALFAAIGTTWGSSGAGTFAVPDLRDRVLIGTSPGGLSPTRPSVQPLANVAGEETHTLVILEIPAHTHGITDPGHYHGSYTGGDFAVFGNPSGTVQAGAALHVGVTPSTASEVTGITVNDVGGDGPHNNMQPFAAINWIIKF